MKEIRVKYKKEKHIALVDDEDFERVSKYKWYLVKTETTSYAHRNIPADELQAMGFPKGYQKHQPMHRFILGEPDSQVDHRDGHGLNNQKDNLRLATPQQNNMNRRKRCDNKTGFVGVTKQDDCKRFRAQIRKNGKVIYLGWFDTPEEASEVYKKAAQQLHGEFYRNND